MEDLPTQTTLVVEQFYNKLSVFYFLVIQIKTFMSNK